MQSHRWAQMGPDRFRGLAEAVACQLHVRQS